VTVWGEQAENCSKYLAKGRMVYIEGRLQTRSWEDKTDGKKRYSTEIVADRVTFLGGGAAEGGGARRGGRPWGEEGASSSSNAAEPEGHGAPPPSDDDIPF